MRRTIKALIKLPWFLLYLVCSFIKDGWGWLKGKPYDTQK